MKKVSCSECKGECCKKLAFQIDEPLNALELEDIKWYLYHEGTIVYIDNQGDWMVQVPVRCAKLSKDGKCTIYDKRPPVCRISKVEDCEMNTNEMDIVFNTVEDFEKYIKRIKKN